MSPRAFLFDFDGTLIDSNEAHIDAWRTAFLAEGHDISRHRIRPEIGKGGDHLVPAILGPDVGESEIKTLCQRHDKAFAKIAAQRDLSMFPGAMELLVRLQHRWYDIALVSSSEMPMLEATEHSVEAPILEQFNAIIAGEAVDRSKPSPDLMLAALERLELAPHECVFIGDTVHDGQAATRAGIPFIGVLCGRCASEADLVLSGAISVWRNPQDLLEHLDQVIATTHSVVV